MNLRIRTNNVSTSLPNLPNNTTTKYTTPSLYIRESGITRIMPLVLEGEENGVNIEGRLYYYDSNQTVKFAARYNGKTYHIPNKNKAITNGIPAGTYSPSAFAALIANYISLNGSRKCANEFTAKVNNQTITVAANSTIYYKHDNYLSYSDAKTVNKIGFGTDINVYTGTSGVHNIQDSNAGFKNYKQYIVRGPTDSNVVFFQQYANYPITIGTGIKFV